MNKIGIVGNGFVGNAIHQGLKNYFDVLVYDLNPEKKINTFVSIFPTTKPKFILAVMLDEPQINSDYIYKYRDGSGFELKGSPRNTAGWNSVETTGHIMEKIGPILATKYSEFE